MQALSVIVDNRERNINIISSLEEKEVELAFAQLPVGDYIISDRICIERKTVADFESSIIDSRLFEQMSRLSASFKKPIMLLEGSDDDFRLGRNVILGTVAKLYVEYNVQVIKTSGAEDTAYVIQRLAEHEQRREESFPRIAGIKKAHNTYEWQILILSSIPGIGTELSKRLITRFKTIRRVMSASVEELEGIDKIGRKKATRIYDILNAEFRGEA
jgi:Fanconi anemia group M protein